MDLHRSTLKVHLVLVVGKCLGVPNPEFLMQVMEKVSDRVTVVTNSWQSTTPRIPLRKRNADTNNTCLN